MEMSRPNAKHGVVAYLDSLGTENLTTEGTQIFIEKKKAFLDAANELWKKRQDQFDKNFDLGFHLPEPEIATFQDSIIICWSDEEQKEKFLPIYLSAGQWLADVFPGAITDYKLFFRGSISVGDYFFDTSQNNVTVLGRAVSDAIRWERLADWIGVIQTPTCKDQYLSFLKKEERRIDPSANDEINLEMIKHFSSLFVPYHIPLKNNVDVVTKWKFFALSWPYWVCKYECKGSISKLLLDESRSLKAEYRSKYENANLFFEWYKKNIFPEIPKA